VAIAVAASAGSLAHHSFDHMVSATVAVGVGSEFPDLSTGFAPISRASVDLNRAVTVDATGFSCVGEDAFNYLLHAVILTLLPYEFLSSGKQTETKCTQPQWL
jgi:hypothetical protein